uniref:Uncharacterized protein n=1 Tax=Panagrolaimus sp. ES5 TaxID=591445 RepID=A0AC34FQ92_9BILA
MNSATPLPAEIEEKYQRSVKSYNYMLTIAMEPEKWLEWMYANFGEKDFIDNFECKIGEHWFMKEIWEYYINYLLNSNKVVSYYSVSIFA